MFAAGTVIVALLAAIRGSLLLAVQAATSTGATEGWRPPAPAFAFPARTSPAPPPPCAALVRGNAHRRRRPPRVVRFASTDDGGGRAAPPPPPTTDVVERHELGEQFGRWRFLQRLLEGEVAARDVEDVLLLSLCAYLEHGPSVSSSENKDENGGNASPVLTPRQRSEVEYVLHSMSSAASDGIGDSRVFHMLVSHPVDYESSSIDGDDAESDYEAVVEVDGIALSMLERMERLLPDPVEDEEAHKSAWDVVMDLHGRESVRVSEESLRRERERGGGGLRIRARSLQWRTLCSVGRVLIHFDFLTKGVLKEGTFTSNNR
jgi:hypothetical protein